MIGRLLGRSLQERTAVDLFCGAAGGWTLGLHWAGVKTVAAVEADGDRAVAHARRWGSPVFRDIRRTQACESTVVRGDLMISDGLYVSRVRRPWLVCGSPPCKGISEVNQKGKGVDDDGLFFEAIRLALELRPLWIALENVSRLKTRGADRVLERLEAGGYACQAIVVGSECAGADHERRRAFIVASDTARRKGRPARFARSEALGPPPGRTRLDLGPADRIAGLGHLGPEAIGRHLRAYDGVSDRVAEFARHAYGDALDPIFPFVIARSLIEWEEGVDLGAEVAP